MNDRMLRGTFPQANLRFAVCQTAGLCGEAIRRHQADWLSGWLLSEALTCGALASVGLKGSEKLTLRWLYPGPVGTILVDTNERGEVRGFPQRLRLLPEISTVAEAIGGDTGRVSATTSLPDRLGPTGITLAVFGDVTRDLAHFFSMSFQVETALSVGLILPPQDPISLSSAVGVLLHPLPGADLEAFDAVRRDMETVEFRDWLEEGPRPLESVLERLAVGEPARLLEEAEPAYACTCSRDKVERVLRLMDPADLRQLLEEQGGAVVQCHFCATVYRYTKPQVDALLELSPIGHG
jgi:molecular chaperone Hsp33